MSNLQWLQRQVAQELFRRGEPVPIGKHLTLRHCGSGQHLHLHHGDNMNIIKFMDQPGIVAKLMQDTSDNVDIEFGGNVGTVTLTVGQRLAVISAFSAWLELNR